MKTSNLNYAVITGASQGLGKSYAIELAKQGRNVLLIARKNEGLPKLTEDIHNRFGVSTACYETDLTRYNNLEKLVSWINANYSVDLLINNVGMGGTVSFKNCSSKYLNSIIQLNIRSLSYITHELLPNMLRQKNRAYVLNVSSMAAFCPMGFKSVYPASKKFIQHFSLGLNYELHDTNISVATVFPGPMRTNEAVTVRIDKQGFLAKSSLQDPEIVARESLGKLFSGKSFIIVGLLNKINWILMTLIPSWILIPLISNAFKKELNINKSSHEFAI